jgi:Lrp/AsnC family transcriptional regulator for asnA, asnC and gidA
MEQSVLSEKEQRIFAAVQLDSELPLAKIRELTGYRDHTIRYALKSMIDRGYIQKRVLLDPHVMGKIECCLYFSVAYESPEARQRLRQMLMSNEAAKMVYELGGEYQFGVLLAVDDISDVHSFFRDLSAQSGVTFLDKAFSTRIASTLFQRNYLSGADSSSHDLTYRRKGRRVELDELDKRILHGLTHSVFRSRRDLARQLGIAHTTLDHRIKRLEAEGVIVGHVYGLQARRIGMNVYRFLVRSRGFGCELWRELHKFSSDNPHVVCLVQCLGNWDFELVVEVEHSEDASDVAQALYEYASSSIISVQTLPLFRFLKISGAPFDCCSVFHEAERVKEKSEVSLGTKKRNIGGH